MTMRMTLVTTAWVAALAGGLWLLALASGVAGAQRFPEDARRIGNDVAAIHGDPARGTDKAGAALPADALARVSR